MTPTPDDAARKAAEEYGVAFESHCNKTRVFYDNPTYCDIEDAFAAGYAKARERAEEEIGLLRMAKTLSHDNRMKVLEDCARLRAVVSCLREGLERVTKETEHTPLLTDGAIQRAREALARAQELEGGG